MVINGLIQQTSSNGIFANPEAGTYEVYAINYDPALAPAYGLGTPIAPLVNGSLDGCYDVAGPAILVALTPVVIEVFPYCPEDPAVPLVPETISEN